MKILMTADTVGGVWTYALELATALASHQVEVALATMGAPLSCEQRHEVRALSNIQVFESCFKLEWMDDPWADVERAGRWLLDLERQISPDIVHLNGYAHGALPWCAPVVMVGHSDVLSWWQAVKGEAAPPEWDRYRAAVKDGLHAADVVLAPTRAMLRLLQEFYGPLPASRVIFNGRAAGTFVQHPKQDYIFAVGRLWDEAKNLAALDAVAAALPWPICVAGEDKHPGGSRAQTRSVRMLGRLPHQELLESLGQAAIYCLPARYESFGLSALEAALCGCALVLGDIPSLREVWGEDAAFVPPDDHECLKATLQNLIEDDTRRLDLAQRAQARAATYTPQRMARQYVAIYRELKRPNPDPRPLDSDL